MVCQWLGVRTSCATVLPRGKDVGRGAAWSDADLPLTFGEQETGGVTVKVYFCGRTEHVPTTMTWEDYLHKRGLGNISHLTFFNLATDRPLTGGATLEAMGYRGGTIAVKYL
jgi:hypothetical protein